jgi:hypothetical protein
MRGYFVEIVLLEKDKVPPKIRPDCWLAEEQFPFLISVGGRLSNTLKKSVVETQELAELLLHHYLPSLESRKYGRFSTRVRSKNLGTWETKWMINNTKLFNEKLVDQS